MVNTQIEITQNELKKNLKVSRWIAITSEQHIKQSHLLHVQENSILIHGQI